MKAISAPSRPGTAQPADLLRAFRSVSIRGALALIAVFATVEESLANEGGVSFWLPGLFGSLAAVPQQPGWSAALIYYHTSVSGEAT